MHPGQKLKPGAVVRFEGAGRRADGRGARASLPGAPDDSLCGRGRAATSMRSSMRSGTCRCRPTSGATTRLADRERYQTVFARVRGSVAAPTAGLHFTPELLDELTARGVERAEVTLHVGYGTFKPIKVDRVEDHVVDPEPYSIGDAAAVAIDRARAEGRRVIAVGTTTTRALEDAARARRRRRARRARRRPRSSSIPASSSRSSTACSRTSTCRSRLC